MYELIRGVEDELDNLSEVPPEQIILMLPFQFIPLLLLLEQLVVKTFEPLIS